MELVHCFSIWHSPLFMSIHRGDKKGICHHLEIATKNQISRKPEVKIDLILAITVLFSDMTLTLHKSRTHCCGVMQFWTCSSRMSATLPAKADCETWVRIICGYTIDCTHHENWWSFLPTKLPSCFFDILSCRPRNSTTLLLSQPSFVLIYVFFLLSETVPD